MPLNFRCYNCWKSLTLKETTEMEQAPCPKCGKRLFIGKQDNFQKSAVSENPPVHNILVEGIHEYLEGKDVYEGDLEVIAGPDIRHKPDAIYYHTDDKGRIKPLIFEAETFDHLEAEHSISQCNLFSLTAKKTNGKFFLIVPSIYSDDGDEYDGITIAKKIMTENAIDCADIVGVDT